MLLDVTSAFRTSHWCALHSQRGEKDTLEEKPFCVSNELKVKKLLLVSEPLDNPTFTASFILTAQQATLLCKFLPWGRYFYYGSPKKKKSVWSKKRWFLAVLARPCHMCCLFAKPHTSAHQLLLVSCKKILLTHWTTEQSNVTCGGWHSHHWWVLDSTWDLTHCSSFPVHLWNHQNTKNINYLKWLWDGKEGYSV